MRKVLSACWQSVMVEKPCCTPEYNKGHSTRATAEILSKNTSVEHEDVLLNASSFLMGDGFDEGYYSDGETPQHEVQLTEFRLDTTTVTNAQFEIFVSETGYQTEAEQQGNSAVFHQDVTASETDIIEQMSVPWWLLVRGANWRHPGGSRSSIKELGDHPVVHISFHDALAYCKWSGRSLPTEAQWEYAARGGLENKRYPWGDELNPDGRYLANIWQGEFPHKNDASDGYLSTAPVKSFQPNEFGLWQMAGNVWEWCSDWFSPNAYNELVQLNPEGPESGKRRVIRGGSYLCHASYCNRYRVAARSAAEPLSSASNIGFRTIRKR